MEGIRGRFAPTPSGFLHLGNVFCFLLAWLYARKDGGSIVLRIEDLDTVRCSKEAADRLAEDLRWLGLDWDEGAYLGAGGEEYFQSCRSEIYARFLAQLEEKGLVYPCFCSRNDLHAANAPHLSDGRIIYPGTCRTLTEEERKAKGALRRPAYRLRTADRDISFQDGLYGRQSYNLAQESGDFILRRSDGVYAYQLAVVADDYLMGVNQVVRGADLLSSTAMQLYLYELLGLAAPSFAHVPLLTAADGRRLAKRDGDMELSALKEKFGSAEVIIGWLGCLAGQLERPEPLTAQELLREFKPEKIPRQNIVVPPQLLQ